MKNINITEEYFLQHNKIKFSDTMHKDKNKKIILKNKKLNTSKKIDTINKIDNTNNNEIKNEELKEQVVLEIKS